MAESSGFFNAELVNGQYDREYLAEAFAKYFSLFIANGVFPNPSDGLQVFENTTADMNVLMHPGYAWIDGYWYKLDGNLTLAIDPADGVLNRIDSIVVRWDLEKRGIYAKVVKGTPASEPTAPEVVRSPDFSDLCIAHIRVDAGTTKIMQSMITDTRMNNSLCGIVTGVVQSIDTTTLFEQYQAALKEFQDTRMVEFDEWQEQEKSDFDTWFETIKGTLDGDTAGNLLNLITQETADRKAADAAIESKLGINATATYEESTVKITAPEGLVVVTFIAPSDCKAGDKYTLNGDALTLTDLNGEPVEDGWKQGAPIVFYITGGNRAFFKAGGMGKLPSDLAPLCPNFTVERNGGKVKISADKIQLNSYTNMVSGGVWAWGKTRPTKPTGENTKQWSRAELITTGKPYDGLYLGDVTPSDAVTETLIYLPENDSGKVKLVPFLVLSTDYLGGVYVMRQKGNKDWVGKYGNNVTYENSTADTWLTSYLNSVLDKSIADKVLECEIHVFEQGTIKRKCWIPSYGELYSDFTDSGNTFMPYFNSNGRRALIKQDDGNPLSYWTRTFYNLSDVRMINSDGSGYFQSASNKTAAYRPSFVLPKDFKIQQRPDGSYTVWNEQGLMALGDVEASNTSIKSIVNATESGELSPFILLSQKYGDKNVSVLHREDLLPESWNSNYSGTTDYASSGIQTKFEEYASSTLDAPYRALLVSVEVTYKNLNPSDNWERKLSTKCCAIGAEEVGIVSGWDLGNIFSYYESSENRKKKHDEGSYDQWYTRDIQSAFYSSNNRWYDRKPYFVNASGTTSGAPNIKHDLGLCPMLFFDPTAPIRQLVDGSYDLVPEDPALATQGISTMAAAGTPVQLTELTEGDIVKINESGSPVDFYVAKHDYESSLNGAGRTLVVRKDTYDDRVWDSGRVNAYASSDLDSWFNSTYKNMLDADIRSLIGTTKIRYTPGNGNNTVGTLERAIFALSLTELGQSHPYANTEGSALPIASALRIAYRNGSATTQWTRSPYTLNTSNAWRLNSDGDVNSYYCNVSFGSRPAFTLPGDAYVTDNGDGTYTFVGDEPIADLSIEFDWPESEPLYARQWVYNEKGVYQTMLLGGIASTEDAPPFKLPEFTGNHAIFGDEIAGRIELYESGDLTLYPGTYDFFLVGGGGSGNHGGGAGSGYTHTEKAKKVDKTQVFSVLVGASDSKSEISNKTVGNILATAEKGSPGTSSSGTGNGGNGGSGGGSYGTGGNGGSNGSNGGKGDVKGNPGQGQGTTTRSFGEENGVLFAGGGGAAAGGNSNPPVGGEGGGGRGGTYDGKTPNTPGTPNTGGGGGSRAGTSYIAPGGSGIIIARWNNAV